MWRSHHVRALAGRGSSGSVEAMSTAVEAIYEAGVLRPLEPLPFEEHTRVRVSVEALPAEDAGAAHRFSSADLAGAYELDDLPATNARVRESLRRRGEESC
jgi:predicted DNA-binding antitoxin AbrB/MazE fold protein